MQHSQQTQRDASDLKQLCAESIICNKAPWLRNPMAKLTFLGCWLAAVSTVVSSKAQLPDLAVTGLSPSGQAVAGQDLTLSYVITNIGTGSAVGYWHDRVILSTTNSISGRVAGAEVGSPIQGDPHSLPTNGSSKSFTKTFRLPAIAAGGYFLIAQADYKSNIVESIETNNLQVLPIQVYLPDLIVTNLNWTGKAAAGQRLTVSYEIKNIGAGFASGNWYDRVTLSTNGTLAGGIQEWGTAGANGGPHDLPGISGSQTITQIIDLPKDIRRGSYYLIAEADSARKVAESNEANNTQVIPLAIDNTDLVAGNLSYTGSPIAGRNISIHWMTTNSGGYEIGGTWGERVAISSSNTFAGAMSTFAEPRPHNVLPTGGVWAHGAVITLPVVPSGTYYIIAKSDSGDQCAETNEVNNTIVLPFFLTNIPPTISLIEPTNSVQTTSCVPRSFLLSAQTQTGSQAITNVKFFAGTSVIANDAKPPYQVASQALAHGIHYITAQVVDAIGQRATSQVATVSVKWPGQDVMLIDRTTNRTCVICMGAQAGDNYVVETTTNLLGAIWRPLRTNFVTGPALVFTNQADLPKQFFRARLVP